MVYGALSPGSSVEVGDFRLELAPGSPLLYRRFEAEEPEPVFSDLVVPGAQADLNISPVTLDEVDPDWTLIQLALKEPISLAPKTRTDLHLTMPHGVAVLATDGFVIDRFEIFPPKLTLYGPVTNGQICHYHSTSASIDTSVLGVMRLEGVVTNLSRKWVQLTRIVFDLPSLTLFYDDKGALVADFLVIEIESPTVATVRSEPRASGEMKRALNTYQRSGVVAITRGSRRTYTMEWGY